jgi:hypothetical protein
MAGEIPTPQDKSIGEGISRGNQEVVPLEARDSSIVSVAELIPGLNLNGLVLNGSPEALQRSKWINFDYNPEAWKPGHLSRGLTTSYAVELFAFPDLSPTKKITAEKTLNAAFKDQTVVDLGAGAYMNGYLLVARAGAKSFIAVEPYFTEEAMESIAEHKKRKQISIDKKKYQLKDVPTALVAEDMLGFLKRVPDNSVSVLCSGIDRDVIDNDYYVALVAEEITRVLAKNGTYIGNSGTHIPLPESTEIRSQFVGERKYSWDRAKEGSFYTYKKV